MATHESLAYPLRIENIQSYQKLNAKRVEISCEYGTELLSESSKSVELESLEEDLPELTHILHIAERPMVKEVIQMDIELILANLESLKDIFKEQFETKVSWTKVVVMKHKKYNYKEQRVAHTFPVTSNRYNLLCNDLEGDDTPVSIERLRVVNPKHVKKEKMNFKKRVLEKKQHKLIILGDSHAKGCGTGVKHLLNNDFEVFGFVNPGSGMKFIKDIARVKLQQLTKKEGGRGSNDIARNNSIEGMKHILEFCNKCNHTNVILMSAPHGYDLIRNSCVNNEVEVFNRKLRKKLERSEKVEMVDVVSERNFYTKRWETSELGR
jgi:hypothetical protein